MNVHSGKPFSIFACAAIFIALFLLFTPFEQGGNNPTMLPKYLAVGASMLVLAPLIILRKLKISAPSILVLVVLSTLIFHVIVIRPVPPQFVLLIAANLGLAILLYEVRFAYRNEFEAALVGLLVICAISVYVQAALFYFITHTIFDVHRLLFGADSRVAEDFLNIARFSGLHVEPGGYTNYVSCLLLIYVFSADLSKTTMSVAGASIFSILITHSASSMFFVTVILLLLGWLWRSRITMLQVLLMLASIVLYVYASNFLEHLLSRFGRDDGSMSLKVLGITTYLRMSLEEQLIGFGFGNDPCTACHYQDVGVLLNLVSRGGLLVAIAVSLLLFRAVKLHGLVLATLIFSIPVYCIVWFYEVPIWLFILFATSSAEMLVKGKRMDRAAAAPTMWGKAGLATNRTTDTS